MFKRTFLLSSVAIALSAVSGCASLFSSNTQIVEIETSPEGASITIINQDGEIVFQGKTPFKEELTKAKGFFKGENYSVHIEKGGYRSVDFVLTSHNNGWYVFGNSLNGFLPGWIGVDPKTTNMYRLDPEKLTMHLVPLEDELDLVSELDKTSKKNTKKRNLK